MMMCDHTGTFFQEKIVTIIGNPEAKVETWTLLQAIHWSIQLELQNFVLEVDCKPIFDGLQANIIGVS